MFVPERLRYKKGNDDSHLVRLKITVDLKITCIFLFVLLQVLFVKNLSAKVTEQDLASLFIQFQDDDSDKIVFKLLNGRMKGQAFVTFNSEYGPSRM